MRFVFPALGLLFIALLFVDLISFAFDAVEQHERFRPFSSTPDMASPPVLAAVAETQAVVEGKGALEILAKTEPETQAAPEISARIESATEPTPEMPSKIESPAEAASEVPAKIEPAAGVARAQAPRVKKRLSRKEQLYRQNHPWSLNADSFIGYLIFGRVD